MMNVSDYIKNDKLKVRIKPNSDKNEVEGYDESRGVVVVRISEPARDNKANKELVRYFSDILGRRVRIKAGASSRTKLLECYY